MKGITHDAMVEAAALVNPGEPIELFAREMNTVLCWAAERDTARSRDCAFADGKLYFRNVELRVKKNEQTRRTITN